MSTELHVNEDFEPIPEANLAEVKIAIICSEWNADITSAMGDAAYRKLESLGVDPHHIDFYNVPGSFELTFAAASVVNGDEYAAAIVFGCVIRGETPHFDYICQGVTQGITMLNAQGKKPVIFGVLTTETYGQALARVDGRMGNKGEECAIDAVKMISFACEI
jgi:6,7-dimethyl-8-ribityllumazine synthase